MSGLNNTQVEQLKQHVTAAVQGAAKQAYDQVVKGFSMQGADGVQGGGSYFNSANAQVPADASSLNQIVIGIPEGTTANAPVLWYGDLINQAIHTTATIALTTQATLVDGTGTTPNIVSHLTPAEFLAAGPVITAQSVFQAPAWLSGGSGFFLATPVNTDQSYQLSVAYMFQNAAIFDVLNISSSESSTQAPVLRSLNVSVTNIGPYGSAGSNVIPALNSTSPQNYLANQLIIPVKSPMTLFHYLTFKTGVAAPSDTDVFFTLVFNTLIAQHRANDIKQEAKKFYPELMSSQGIQLKLGPARP